MAPRRWPRLGSGMEPRRPTSSRRWSRRSTWTRPRSARTWRAWSPSSSRKDWSSPMGELWIGVTGLYSTDNPHPGLGVIRALRQADPSWRILALIPDRFATGAYAPELIDAHAVLPPPWSGPEVLDARLRAIARRHPLD